MAAHDRKAEIEKCLAKIRKSQPNLLTQVRLVTSDFDIKGKYVYKGKLPKYEDISIEKIDPEGDLFVIKFKGSEEQLNISLL